MSGWAHHDAECNEETAAYRHWLEYEEYPKVCDRLEKAKVVLAELMRVWDIHYDHYNGIISDSSEWDWSPARDYKHEFDSAWEPALAAAKDLLKELEP